MSETFDFVVAGAGHNSLITAAYLTKAGYRCLILEANAYIGGNTATEELTLPGVLHDSCSTSHSIFMESPIWRNHELPLAEYGLEYITQDLAVHMPFPDGTWLTLWRDLDRSCGEFAKFSQHDADAYRQMMIDYQAIAPIFGRVRYSPSTWSATLEQSLAEHPQGGRWLRRYALTASDIINENFQDWHTRAFMLWMAFGTVQPFDRPETGLLAYSFVAGRQRNGWSIPKGGSGALPVALARYIEASGGVIQTSKPVNSLILEGGRCVGVTTEDGGEYRAQHAVISTMHVKHLIEMAPKDLWGDAFTYGVETWNPGSSMVVAHYATTVAPEFPVDNGVVTCIAAGIAPSEERMWQLLWDTRRGRVNTVDPSLLVLVPSVGDPSRAPNGMHMVKVLSNHPYDIPGGPQKWDEIKEEVAARDLAQLRRFAPNLTDDKILATALKSPLDLERRNRHNWHGSCHGGDMGPAQSGSWRPAPGWGDHRMPIPGLYQTGATTHPGGSVTGAPGRNAAMVVLKDLGRDFSEVVSAKSS